MAEHLYHWTNYQFIDIKEKKKRMYDVLEGDFSDLVCSDCGEKGCRFRYFGYILTAGIVGTHFCAFCWEERTKSYDWYGCPRPVGVKPPGLERKYWGRTLRVITNTSVLVLEPTKNPKRFNVRHGKTNEILFGGKEVEVLLLAIGAKFWLRILDGEKPETWHDRSRVALIKVEQGEK